MKRKTASQKMRMTQTGSQPDLSTAAATGRGLWPDLREIVVPANKWHYAFHAVVVAVAVAYWNASLLWQPDASWAEIVMYRPGGDNQVWPVITALSHFNLGDPTDSIHYGEGVAGFHAVILLPYALAFAVFGPAGYMIADALLSWCYFVAAAMLFRRWGLGTLGSISLSSALTTSSLQFLLQKISDVPARIITLCKHGMAEWDFPNIFTLNIFGDRVPRPMPTEIFLVLILYFLSRLWLEHRLVSAKRGIAIGVLMGLLVQGDPYSFAAAGLLLLALIVRTTALRHGRLPWRFCVAGLAGAALSGWYLIVQFLFQHPDSAARFGLAKYSRSKILLLPGYGPWLRLFVVIGFALVVRWIIRRCQMKFKAPVRSDQPLDPVTASNSSPASGFAEASAMAFFAVVAVAAAWLAQPVQLLLLGKGAQIFHYLYFTLPIFYSFCVILLMVQLFKVLNLAEWISSGEKPRTKPHRVAALLSGGALAITLVIGLEDSLDSMMFSGLSRREISPWSTVGNEFRPALRALDKEFRENPSLKSTRSIAAICQEVNFLLTAFHDKRAYLPDNAFTTLSDDELENRLCEVAKLSQMKPEEFSALIRHQYIMNFWLGCAKYWCASDYKFAPEADYEAHWLEAVRQMPRQSPFTLVLPISEFRRIMEKYIQIINRPSDTSQYPDAVIMSVVLSDQNITLDANLYRETYTNKVFKVYTKIAGP